MSNYPDNLKYMASHEWFNKEEKTMGISDFAVEHLGDVVEVVLPEVGTEVSKGEEIGTVESVKTASPIYAPVSGTVTEINEELEDAPELVNDSPYTDGWFIKIEVNNESELEELMDAGAYAEHCAKEEEE